MSPIILGGICSWIGTILGFGLQIAWQEYKERIIHHRKVKLAFICCLKDFISCMDDFASVPNEPHRWICPLWDSLQLDFVSHFPNEYQAFSPAVAKVNASTVAKVWNRTAFITVDYRESQRIAQEVLQSLED